MTRKRALIWIALAVCAALVLASPIPSIVGFILYVGIFQTLFPSTISWDAKNAYVKCNGAIADPRIWPASPNAACGAMYLCVNEAPLSDQERTRLYEQIRKTPGCQEP